MDSQQGAWHGGLEIRGERSLEKVMNWGVGRRNGPAGIGRAGVGGEGHVVGVQLDWPLRPLGQQRGESVTRSAPHLFRQFCTTMQKPET